jgi:hypothetical protein
MIALELKRVLYWQNLLNDIIYLRITVSSWKPILQLEALCKNYGEYTDWRNENSQTG